MYLLLQLLLFFRLLLVYLLFYCEIHSIDHGKKDLERYGKGLLAHREIPPSGREKRGFAPVSLDRFGAKLRFASRPRLFEKRRPKNFLSGSAAECLRCLFAPRLCRTMSRVRAAGFAGAFPPGHGLIGLSRSSPARRGTSCAAPPASPGARPPRHGGRSGGTRRR